MTAPRLRFAEFTIAPGRRLLLRDGQPVPLIPKYFDLLVLLLHRRHEALSKDAIFAAVWADVVVSDGALAQAIRTLRRTLGDDSREPRFIRTVARHGYQFIWPEVIEEPDDPYVTATPDRGAPRAGRDVSPLVAALLAETDREAARDLAEQLHGIDTAAAVAELTTRPHHGPAMAMMRETRWAVADAGEVPILRDPEAPRTVLHLIRLRIGDVRQVLARRLAGAITAGAAGGVIAGLIGGVALVAAADSPINPETPVALAAIGAAAGSVGAGGVGAGLVAAEALARSHRTLWLAVCAGLSGALTAGIASHLVRLLLHGLVGLTPVHPGGALDGLLLGLAAGLGYGAVTAHSGGGIAAPRGSRRAATAAVVGLSCGVAAVALAWAGRPLIGGLIHELARSSRDADLGLGPLGRLIGEPDFGQRTQLMLSAFEGFAFGAALAFGMTKRPGRV